MAGFLGKGGKDRVPRNRGLHFHVLKHTNSGIYVTAPNVAGDELVGGNDVIIVELMLMGV